MHKLLPVVAAMMVAPLFVGCGTSAPCSAATCTGCCLANGECASGTSFNACGRGGFLCTDCRGGTCSNGSCSSVGTGGGGAGGGGGTNAGGGGGARTGGGGGSSSNAPSCSVPEDCPYWYCECLSGPPVNSRRCVNNRCQDGAQACPGACAGFNTCWTGLSSGGFQGGSNAGPSTCGSTGGGSGSGGGGGSQSACPYSDLGKGCSASSDCQSGLCFGVSPSFVCTMGCSTANDCPQHWTCQSTSSGGVCMIGSPSGTPSTSTRCFGNTFSDLGAACSSSCQSKFCSGNVCTRRCNGEFDCPSSWSCVTSDFKYCAP